jgi:type IV secretory pathway VirB2 component (pilin)
MKHKKTVFLFFLAGMAALPAALFAQGVMPPGMETLAQSIFDIFTGNFVKVILAIFFCGAAIAYGFNKDNEKVKRSCIAIAIACAILISAQSIVNAVWTASGG